MDSSIFHNLGALLDEQLAVWPQARQAFKDLDNVQTRTISAESGLSLQFNPARIVSTAAKTSPHAVAARKCFLCKDARPSMQRAVPLNQDFDLLVNPYPILREHFCIVSRTHRPQLFSDCCSVFLEIAASLPTGYMVFYNGPHSGASAPDHLHMQLGKCNGIPLCEWILKNSDKFNSCTDKGPMHMSQLGYPVLLMRDTDPVSLSAFLKTVPVPENEQEPRMNVISLNDGTHVYSAIVLRSHHRPSCYYTEGSGRHMVSPGAIDMCGLVITPLEQDFKTLKAGDIQEIYREVTPSKPMLKIGIMCAPSINFTLTGNFTVNETGTELSGAHKVTLENDIFLLDGKPYTELSLQASDNSTFTLNNVTIGINFHWQRNEPQTFKGSLEFVVQDSQVWAVNIIDIEEYLESVISSEMKPTAGIEFMKAHAVISRSWIISQLQGKNSHNPNIDKTGKKQPKINDKDRIVRWYDHEQHKSFDVCADDHCQRYQGITRIISSAAKRAVSETFGQILMYDSHLCDTRFSKSCGGRTEQFENCWEDRKFEYLQSVECPFCGRADKNLLEESLNGYDLETDNFNSWEKHYNVQEISALFRRKSGLEIGDIIDMEPLATGPSGRIVELSITGTERSVTIGKELEIRRILSETHLLSSAFSITRETDSQGKTTGFTLKGKGWGHGVGLCQIGAAVMGAEGYDYTQILKHYYKGATIGFHYYKE